MLKRCGMELTGQSHTVGIRIRISAFGPNESIREVEIARRRYVRSSKNALMDLERAKDLEVLPR